jgi:haloacetate dehalogenase
MPALIVAGAASFRADGPSLLNAWREWGDDIAEARVESGLYPMEEAPAETLAVLENFL